MSVDGPLRVAESIVDAFSRHDSEQYFSHFSPESTFIFYNHATVIESREEYQQLWAKWEVSGFHVLGCHSLNPEIRMLSENVAVFVHQVRTVLADDAGPVHLGERETIVLQHIDGQWLGVHEHLSPDPTYSLDEEKPR